MPKIFRYKNPETKKVQFQCNINEGEDGKHCKGCQATKGATFQKARVDGQPGCKRNTCLNSLFCFQHLAIVCHLRIKKSIFLERLGLNEMGLYIHEPKVTPQHSQFKKGFLLKSGLPGKRLYGGERVNEQSLSRRYDYIDSTGKKVEATAPYGIMLNNNKLVDSACVRGPLSYANDSRKSRGNNGEITRNGNLRIIRNIKHGDEILVSYGEEYWK